ncbi:hypothetical protein BS50DRAFT_134339 [Corynespora cassiicola Philippines]|uniref:Secreted protein n=1 Tax=Corynespora cassiicola Philippines TaxID=1448308 RepID=A0A2T2N967_CORCC|nr:hypothetical protein BS50DRAFT_134339 [Corynespora cassiicola Philippines]
MCFSYLVPFRFLVFASLLMFPPLSQSHGRFRISLICISGGRFAPVPCLCFFPTGWLASSSSLILCEFFPSLEISILGKRARTAGVLGGSRSLC